MQCTGMLKSDFGIGVYSVPEAARMIGMGNQTLRRWLLGYDHNASDGMHHHSPLWPLQHDLQDDEIFLGFRDLIEARIVNALRRSGISLQAIRECLDIARQIINDAHPFSTKHFKTDGKSLFLEIAEKADDPHLIDLKRRQHVFRTVVAPSLSGLEFGNEAAERWWLLDGKKTVVADPSRSFGQPIMASSGLTTKRIKEAVEAEGSIEKTAKVYEIRVSEVRDALAYEQAAARATLH